MNRKTFEAARDCASKIKGLKPSEKKVREMFSFLSIVDRLAAICKCEGPDGIKLEADKLPNNTAYERIFRESLQMWLTGCDINKAVDHAADRYFSEAPSGYDAAIFFAAVYSTERILLGESSYEILDKALQFFLPDGWRWREEDDKEAEAHKDDKDWFSYQHSHRKAFIGDNAEIVKNRFDDVKVCELISKKDEAVLETGRMMADRLSEFRDGALQLILKELTYTDIEKVLYVLPEKAEERIISNINSYSVRIIKGQCILNKDSVSSSDIREALSKLEEAINAYDGDPALEAEYED